MAIKALNLAHVHRHVSKNDPDYSADGNHGSGATVWLVGPLTSVQQSMLRDDLASFAQEGGMTIRNADNDLLAARMALRGWENFDVQFEARDSTVRSHKMALMTPEVTAQVPFDVLQEVGRLAKKNSHLDVSTEKNSVSGSSPSSSSESATVEPAQ